MIQQWENSSHALFSNQRTWSPLHYDCGGRSWHVRPLTITLSLHLLSCPCSAHIHDLLRQHDVKQGVFPWHGLQLYATTAGIFVNGMLLQIPERQCYICVMYI